MPWARGFCPYRACGDYLQNLSESIIKLKKIVYILSDAKNIVLLHLTKTKEDWQSDPDALADGGTWNRRWLSVLLCRDCSHCGGILLPDPVADEK